MQLEFGGRLAEHVFVDAGHIERRGLQQAGDRQVVDRPRQAAGEVVQQLLDFLAKDLRVAPGLGDLKVDVLRRLLFVQRSQLIAHRDPVQQVRVLCPLDRAAQRILSDQQNLQRRTDIQRRTDQQPQVGQRLGRQQMRLVEDQQQGSLGASGPFQNLLIDTILAAPRRLAELRGDELQQSRGGQMREMTIDDLTLLRRERD